ncbi:MAG: hypothetical protein IJM78_02200 [Prevotella sp.]|nr:hypothetical protein [Prevotella sp.]
MKTKRFYLVLVALLMAVAVSAQPPRIRQEARRMTNHVDRRVGLSRPQYDRIYEINLRFAGGRISPGQRDRAYRSVLTTRQWERYMGRPAPGPRHRYDGPRHHPRRDYDRRRYDRRRYY